SSAEDPTRNAASFRNFSNQIPSFHNCGPWRSLPNSLLFWKGKLGSSRSAIENRQHTRGGSEVERGTCGGQRCWQYAMRSKDKMAIRVPLESRTDWIRAKAPTIPS